VSAGTGRGAGRCLRALDAGRRRPRRSGGLAGIRGRRHTGRSGVAGETSFPSSDGRAGSTRVGVRRQSNRDAGSARTVAVRAWARPDGGLLWESDGRLEIRCWAMPGAVVGGAALTPGPSPASGRGEEIPARGRGGTSALSALNIEELRVAPCDSAACWARLVSLQFCKR